MSECKEKFEEWADGKNFVMDEIFMSTDGVPDNPFTDDDTKLAYEIWCAAWEASYLHLDSQYE